MTKYEALDARPDRPTPREYSLAQRASEPLRARGGGGGEVRDPRVVKRKGALWDLEQRSAEEAARGHLKTLWDLELGRERVRGGPIRDGVAPGTPRSPARDRPWARR